MRRSQLFGFIKSANTLIFFCVGLLLLSVLGYAAYQIYSSTFRDRSISEVVRLDGKDEKSKTKVSLETFEPIVGTPYLFAPISAEQDYRQVYYDKSALSVRNYLVLNLNDKSAVRVVPNNNSLFLNADRIGQKNEKGEIIKTQAIWYQVIKTDTNGDKRLTETDQKTIAISDVSGKNYTELLPKVDRILGTHQPAATTLLLIHQTDEKNFVTEIDVLNRKVTETKELPAIE